MTETIRSSNKCEPLGRFLRRRREACRLSLREAARRTEGRPGSVTYAHLGKVEREGVIPSVERLQALCRAYGVPIATALAIIDDCRLDAALPEGMTREELFAHGEREVRSGDAQAAVMYLRGGLQQARSRSCADDGSVRDLPLELHRQVRLLAIAYRDVGHTERAIALLEALLRGDGLPEPAREEVVHNAINLYLTHGELGTARRMASRALDAGASPRVEAGLHSMLSQTAFKSGYLDRAIGRAETALVAYESLRASDEAEQARANLARLHVLGGEPGYGRTLHLKALSRSRHTRCPRIRHSVHLLYGLSLADLRQYPRARRELAAARDIVQLAGHGPRRFAASYHLWRLAALRGDAQDERTELKHLLRLRPQVLAATDEVRAFDRETSGRDAPWL